MDRDEQPVVALYHRVSCGRASNSFTAAVTPVKNRSTAEPLSMRANGRTVVGGGHCRRQAGGQGVRCGLIDEHSRDPRHDRLAGATAAQRDDGTAARLCFDRHDAEVLFAWQHDGRCAPIQVPDLLVGDSPQPLDVGANPFPERHQPGSLRAVTHNLQGYAGEAGRLNGHIDTLVRDEGGNHEDVGAWRPAIWMIEPSVHGRVHHESLAIIVSTDPAGNIV